MYVGSGFERKGVAAALAAIAPLAGVHLLVVGHDKHAARYQAQARALGVAERVIFTGAQKTSKLLRRRRRADPAHPVRPFPNVCVEALACGLPLFTSTGCSAAEWIRPGENGWVRDALDVAGFTADIASWLQARADWPSLRAHARAVEPYTLEAMAEELLGLYRRLLGQADRYICGDIPTPGTHRRPDRRGVIFTHRLHPCSDPRTPGPPGCCLNPELGVLEGASHTLRHPHLPSALACCSTSSTAPSC